MLKVNIQKGQASIVEATGTVEEITTDIAVVVNTIYTQFNSVDPETAHALRIAFSALVNEPRGLMWKPLDGQSGIIFQKTDVDI